MCSPVQREQVTADPTSMRPELLDPEGSRQPVSLRAKDPSPSLPADGASPGCVWSGAHRPTPPSAGSRAQKLRAHPPEHQRCPTSPQVTVRSGAGRPPPGSPRSWPCSAHRPEAIGAIGDRGHSRCLHSTTCAASAPCDSAYEREKPHAVGSFVERVTRIELALSAWEAAADRSSVAGQDARPTWDSMEAMAGGFSELEPACSHGWPEPRTSEYQACMRAPTRRLTTRCTNPRYVADGDQTDLPHSSRLSRGLAHVSPPAVGRL